LLKLNSILLFLAMTATSSPAFAIAEKDCGDIRLDQNGGPFAEMPVYNQLAFADKSDTNICFAVAASQIIDAHRFSEEGKLPAQLTAPVSLALTTKYNALGWTEVDILPQPGPEAILGTESVREALENAKVYPVCDQNWLDQFEGSFGKKNSPAGTSKEDAAIYALYPSKRNFLRAVIAEVDSYRDIPLPFLAGLRGGKPEPKITQAYFECRVEENTIPLKDILEAIKAGAAYATPLGKTNAFFKSFCAKHMFQPKIPPPQIFARQDLFKKGTLDMEPYRTGEMEKKANELLNSQPLVLNLCGGALKTPGASQINDDRMGFFHADDCAIHAAVLVGRKYNKEKKSCEFLVRDSYGPDCEDAEGKPRYDRKCENGNVWVDSTQLMRSTFHLIWL
jgi:hypothetical protein